MSLRLRTAAVNLYPLASRVADISMAKRQENFAGIRCNAIARFSIYSFGPICGFWHILSVRYKYSALSLSLLDSSKKLIDLCLV